MMLDRMEGNAELKTSVQQMPFAVTAPPVKKRI